MPSRRIRVRLAFAACALFAILGLFVVHGAGGGVLCFAAMLGFALACIYALAGTDQDLRDRASSSGWRVF